MNNFSLCQKLLETIGGGFCVRKYVRKFNDFFL